MFEKLMISLRVFLTALSRYLAFPLPLGHNLFHALLWSCPRTNIAVPTHLHRTRRAICWPKPAPSYFFRWVTINCRSRLVIIFVLLMHLFIADPPLRRPLIVSYGVLMIYIYRICCRASILASHHCVYSFSVFIMRFFWRIYGTEWAISTQYASSSRQQCEITINSGTRLSMLNSRLGWRIWRQAEAFFINGRNISHFRN